MIPIQDVLDGAPEAIIVCRSRTQELLLVNVAAVDLFGYSKEEFASLRISDLLPTDRRKAHDSSMAKYADAPKKREMDSDLQITGKTKDGAVIPLDIALGPHEMNGENYVIAIIVKKLGEPQKQRLMGALTTLLAKIKTLTASA